MAHALNDLANEAKLDRALESAAPGIVQEPVESRKEQKDSPLYSGRVWVYPKTAHGLFRRVKWIALAIMLGIYYLLPWVRWERGPNVPDQAVMIDMEARRAYFFWIEIWPQEVYYITGLLILASFGLFFATSLFGRVWCGFACPQTVWTDLYMWVENKVEGDRAERIRLDKQPWSTAKVRKKITKHGLWLLIAALTGGALIMYFHDATALIGRFLTGQVGSETYFFFGLFTFTTYLLAGIAREQVCTYMCPWPRIQGALFDEDTLAVTYEAWRGEPRGPVRKGQGFDGRGDCIDCKQCVAVCPVGVDIRDGLQLECIGCALCIDACNDVMDKVGRPRNLITYDSARNTELRAAGEAPKFRLIRPRTLIYVALLGFVGTLMLTLLATRSTTDITIQRDRGALFTQLSDGSVRNTYTVKIHNKSHEPRLYALSVEGLPSSATFRVGGRDAAGTASVNLPADPDDVTAYTVFLSVPADDLESESVPLHFIIQAENDGENATHNTVFRGPEQ